MNGKRTLTARSAAILALLAGLLASGCATLGIEPEKPEVRVIGARPLSLSLTRQKIVLTLSIVNPNGFELPIRSLDFVALLGEDEVARGNSEARVVVPANGEAELDVVIVTGLKRTLGRIGRQLERGEPELEYRVTGFARLDNWPKRLAFDVEGSLEPRNEQSVN